MRAHLGFIALVLLGSACSVINSFDEVSAISDASGGKSNSGGSNEGGSGGSGDGGSDTGGGPGTGGGAGADTGPEPGLIVAIGTDADDSSNILSVMSPQTGEELSREENALYAGMAHDPKTNTWYFAKFDTVIHLVARTFDREKNKWTTLTTTPPTIPTPINAQAVLAMPDRVAVITENADNSAEAELHVFDSSDPSDLSEVTGSPLDLGVLTDIKGALIQKLTVGGTVIVVRQVTCTGGPSCIELQNVLASSGVPTGLGKVIVQPPKDPSIGKFAWGFDPVDEHVLLAAPDTSTATGVTAGAVYVYTAGETHTASGTELPFNITNGNDGANLSGIAFDPCHQIAFVDGPKLNGVRSIPLRATTPAVDIKDHLHPGSGVEFEQETRSLISYGWTNGAKDVAAYKLTGTDMAPKLVTRTDWESPTDLQADYLIAAQPKTPCVDVQ